MTSLIEIAILVIGTITILWALLSLLVRIMGCILSQKEAPSCELIECVPLSQDRTTRLDVIVARQCDINYVAIARRPVVEGNPRTFTLQDPVLWITVPLWKKAVQSNGAISSAIANYERNLSTSKYMNIVQGDKRN